MEVTIDSIYLNQIVIGGFEDFSLDLDTIEVNPETEVIVYAYDHYLNYSSEYAFPVSSDPGEEIPINNITSVSIVPNPCSSAMHLRYRINDKRLTICDLYTISGTRIERLIDEVQMPGEHEIEVNVSDLPVGLYLIRLQAGNDIAYSKLLIAH